MSMGDVMDRVEVLLSEETLKNLLEPDKLFKKDLTPQKVEGTNSEKQKCPLASLFLEKMAGNVVKLFVTVRKLDDSLNMSSNQQLLKATGDSCVVEHSAMQTDEKAVDVSVTQTEKTDTGDVSMQTERKVEKTRYQQTEKKQEKHQLQQTIKSEHRDGFTQTFVKMFNSAESQTVTKPIVEQYSQTDTKLLKESWSQSDSSMALQEESCCQTSVSVFNLIDGQCQTVIDAMDSTSQTEINTVEEEIQATVDNRSILCQATVAMEMKDCQTECDSTTVDSQTELSMLNQTDQECQAGVENRTQDIQTDMSFAFMEELGVQTSLDTSEISQQTDMKELVARIIQTDYLGLVAETQTTPDVNNHEVQTDEVVISLPNTLASEAAIPTELDKVMPQIHQQKPVAGVPELADDAISECGTQTDPVTIIIGDASFLVQKLKSSTLQQAKNEIEIEVGEGSSQSTPNGTTPQQYRQPRSNPSTPRVVAPQIKTLTPSPMFQGNFQKSATKRSQQIVGAKSPYMPGGQSYDKIFSCPFCDMQFPESPMLYQHITNSHSEAASKQHKKPRGREGKTILPRSRVGVNPPYLIPQPLPTKPGLVDEAGNPFVEEEIVECQAQLSDPDGPPVLEPVYAFESSENSEFRQPMKKRKTYVRQQVAEIEEPGLFEDLPSPTRSYPRNRVKREETEEQQVQLERQEVVVQMAQYDSYEYECPHCPEKYGSASHLYTHLKRSHKDDMEKSKHQPLTAKELSSEHYRVETQTSEPSLETEEDNQQVQDGKVAPDYEEYVEEEELIEEPNDGDDEISLSVGKRKLSMSDGVPELKKQRVNDEGEAEEVVEENDVENSEDHLEEPEEPSQDTEEPEEPPQDNEDMEEPAQENEEMEEPPQDNEEMEEPPQDNKEDEEPELPDFPVRNRGRAPQEKQNGQETTKTQLTRKKVKTVASQQQKEAKTKRRTRGKRS